MYEIRLFTPSGTRKNLPSRMVGPISFTLDASGNFADFSLSLAADSDAERSYVATGDRVEVWHGGVRRYRGTVSDINLGEQEPATLDVSGYGRVLSLSQQIIEGYYQYPYRVDISRVFSEIAAEYTVRYPDVVVLVEEIGVGIEVLDTNKKSVKDAFDALVAYARSEAVWGFDVDESGRDRLFLRRISTTVDHTISIPGAATGDRERKLSDADLVNVVTVTGGDAKYPQLLPNPSMEVLVRASDGSNGNLLDNGDFTQNTTNWTLTGGASTKLNGNDDPPAFSGDRCLELDNPGEKASQTVAISATPLVPGRSYLLSCWVRPEYNAPANDLPAATQTVYWLGSSGSVLSAIGFPCQTDSQRWTQITNYVTCPAGAVGFRVELSWLGGSYGNQRGIQVDDITFADSTEMYVDGWRLHPFGSATVQAEAAKVGVGVGKHGRVAAYLKFTASNANDNDIHFTYGRPVNATNADPVGYTFEVVGGRSYRFGVWEKYEATWNRPLQKFEVRWRKSDSSVSTISRQDFTPTSSTDWQYIYHDFIAPNDATRAEVWITMRGDGEMLLDCISVRDAADLDSSTWLDAGPLSATFTATDLVTETENADVHNSIATFGRREKVVSVSDISTVDEARSWAKAYLLTQAALSKAPNLTVFDWATPIFPGDLVRLVGPDAGHYADTPLPVARVNAEIDDAGTLSYNLELVRPIPTEEELYASLITDSASKKIAVTGAGASSLPRGGSVPTGDGGGGSIPSGTANAVAKYDGSGSLASSTLLSDSGSKLIVSMPSDEALEFRASDASITGKIAAVTVNNAYGQPGKVLGLFSRYNGIGSGVALGTYFPDSNSYAPCLVIGNELIDFKAPVRLGSNLNMGRNGDGSVTSLVSPEVGPLFIYGNNAQGWANDRCPVMLGMTGVDLSVSLTDADRQAAVVVGFWAGSSPRTGYYGIDSKTLAEGFLGSVQGDGTLWMRGGLRSSDGSKGATVTDDGIVFKDGLRISGTSGGSTSAEVIAARTRSSISPFSAATYASLSEMVASIWASMAGIYNRTISAGTGLTGGGDLNSNRTISIANSGVGTAQIADSAVTTTQIADASITTAKIGNLAVITGNIANGAVNSAKLSDDAVTSIKIQNGAVDSSKIANLGVATGNIANDAVTSAKIADNAVTNSEIQDGAVGTTKLANLCVTTVKIVDGAVNSAKVEDNAVVTAKIQDNAVTTAKIANGSVTAAKMTATGITDGSVLKASGGTVVWGASSSGTVTSVSASVPTGLSVVVTNSTTTPAIAITTTLSGIIKGTGSGFTAATAGTDYAAASHTHAASDITTGTMATARLGSGTASSTTFLRGDGTWAAVSSGSSAISYTFRLALMFDESPSSAGGQKVAILPYASDGSSLYFVANKIIPRAETPPSGGTLLCTHEFYSGTGAFTGTAGAVNGIQTTLHEPATGIAFPQNATFVAARSGDKVRINLGSSLYGAAGITVYAEYSVTTTDPFSGGV